MTTVDTITPEQGEHYATQLVLAAAEALADHLTLHDGRLDAHQDAIAGLLAGNLTYAVARWQQACAAVSEPRPAGADTVLHLATPDGTLCGQPGPWSPWLSGVSCPACQATYDTTHTFGD